MNPGDEIFKPVSKEQQEAASALPPGYIPFTEEALQETVASAKDKSPDLANLSEEQLQEIVRRVQAALLKQAKRSRKTGIKRLPEDTP